MPTSESAAVVRLRALAHPVRLRILSLLTGAAMTAAEVARELRLTHANASYHLRHLLAAGEIEPAGAEQIRGGRAKRYRCRMADPAEQAAGEFDGGPALPEQRLVFAAMAAELQRRAVLLRRRRDNCLTDAELWVAPGVWADLCQRVLAAATDLHQAAQPPRSKGTIRVNATVALFEMRPA